MANNIIINTKDKERPYSCPKCGGEIEKTEYVEYTTAYSIDPVTGGESNERESKTHDVTDAQYYCIAENCGWGKWEDELHAESKQPPPESIPTASNIVIPSPV